MNELQTYRPKVYLAGFEVFRPDASEHGRQMKQLCAEYGFEGIFPLDKDIKPQPTKLETATAIFEGNVKLVHKADIIIANLNPFRGHEPDSGTVFECGLGYALNKKLYGHIEDGRSITEKLQFGIDSETGLYQDSMNVENFELPINLMLGISIEMVHGTLEDALRKAREDLASSL